MTAEASARALATHAARRLLCRSGVAWSLVALLGLVCDSALAQRWQSSVTLTGVALATDNSRLGSNDSQSELITSLEPSLAILGEGPRFKLSAKASANAVAYTQGTRDNHVYPQADVRLTVVPVERLFSIDGGVRVAQAFTDPFAMGSSRGTGIGENAITTTQVNVNPTLEFTLLPLNLHVKARSEHSRLYDNDDNTTATGSVSGSSSRHSALVESVTRPLSWALTADRTETRYDDAVQPKQISDNARFLVDYWFGDQFSLGLRVGAERNNFIVDSGTQRVHGGQFTWLPTERTRLAGSVEKRFFGTGWSLDFTHRMPWLAWSASFTRDISTTQQELLRLPATGDVAALLDASLTTRFPDPFERARQVQDLINRTGLPASLLSSAVIYDQRISLSTSGTFSVAYIGVRHSIALSATYGKLQDVPGSVALITGSPLNNNISNGIGLTVTQRLTPIMTLSGEATRSELRSTASSLLGRNSERRDLSLTLQRQLSPRSGLRLGARYTQLIQNEVSEHEASLLAAFDHRF